MKYTDEEVEEMQQAAENLLETLKEIQRKPRIQNFKLFGDGECALMEIITGDQTNYFTAIPYFPDHEPKTLYQIQGFLDKDGELKFSQTDPSDKKIYLVGVPFDPKNPPFNEAPIEEDNPKESEAEILDLTEYIKKKR